MWTKNIVKEVVIQKRIKKMFQKNKGKKLQRMSEARTEATDFGEQDGPKYKVLVIGDYAVGLYHHLHYEFIIHNAVQPTNINNKNMVKQISTKNR